jgi:tRNA(His) 5'-end guanylyltransferase
MKMTYYNLKNQIEEFTQTINEINEKMSLAENVYELLQLDAELSFFEDQLSITEGIFSKIFPQEEEEINMGLLNKNLIKRQNVSPTQEKTLVIIYTKLGELLKEAENDIDLEKNGKYYTEEMKKLEFLLQENWNFKKDPKFHTYEFSFRKCTCPKMDNRERFGFDKHYSLNCPFHKHYFNEMGDSISLGDRMKSYEKDFEIKVLKDEHIIIRLDGNKFSKFMKGFKKPFDNIFVDVMNKTSKDLLEHFGAYTVFVQSDEITLFLPSKVLLGDYKDRWAHTHSGRIQKLASLTSAYCTMKFNKHLREMYNNLFENWLINTQNSSMMDKYLSMLGEKLDSAHFDARVFGVPSGEEVFNAFLFRNRDYIKNSKSMYAQTYCSHSKLMNKNSDEQIKIVLETSGNEWNTLEDGLKYGRFFKKEQYEKTNEDKTKTIRSRIVEYSEELKYSEEAVSKILKKYL